MNQELLDLLADIADHAISPAHTDPEISDAAKQARETIITLENTVETLRAEKNAANLRFPCGESKQAAEERDFLIDKQMNLLWRIDALESALQNLLDHANPCADEEYAEYVVVARNAETVLRGGITEGARTKSGNLD